MPKKSPAASAPRGGPSAGGAPGAVWIAAGLLAALLPWAVGPGATRDPFSDSKWPLAIAGLAVLACLALARKPSESDADPPLGGLPALFCFGAGLIAAGLALSSAFSPAPALGFKTALREVAFAAAACLLAARAASPRGAQVFTACYLVSAVLQAALVIAQWKLSEGQRLTGRAAMIGTFGNPEYAAGWLAPALAAAVVWFFHAPARLLPRALLGGAALILGVALVLGGGRGAALAASAGVALALAVPSAGASAGRSRRAAPAAAALLLLALAALSGALLSPSARGQSLAGRMAEMFDPYSISVRHRIGLMVVTSRMIGERPLLGAGPGRFAAEFDLARGRLAAESPDAGPWAFNELLGDQSANEAHCDPLQWWAEYGLAPLAGLMLMLSCAAVALAGAARAATPPVAPAARVLLAILAALAVGMLFSFPLHRPARALLFWLSLGLALALARAAAAGADAKSLSVSSPST